MSIYSGCDRHGICKTGTEDTTSLPCLIEEYRMYIAIRKLCFEVTETWNFVIAGSTVYPWFGPHKGGH